ncbi:DUF4270 family protein [Reichenbachiella sp.]|uniref:DUF4270 family protein n=1 Tax=Reichenbachiella sp. TaxID=2184521 RepID=UPI003296A80C
MNLLVKNWSGLLIVVALTIFSCEDSSDIGLGLDPDGIRLNVLYAELPLEATNVRIDSVRTSGDSRLLAGRSSDPIFGDITSTVISRLSYQNAVTTVPTSVSEDRDSDGKQIYFIDSAVLYLQISKVHTSNFAPAQTFNIYQLADTLFPGPSYLSNFDTPYLTSQLEGQLRINLNEDSIRDFVVKDSLQYVVSTRLADSFAEKVFGYAEDDQQTASSNLIYDYKGIAIVPDPTNTALVGFRPADSSSIRIHYHIRDHYLDDNLVETDSLYEDSLSLNIALNGAGAYYNQISIDRSTSLMNAEAGDYNSFEVGNGSVYLQPVSGIYPKINLDTLTKFLAAYPNVQINRMEFAIETKENGKYQDNVENMRFLYVDATDGSKVNASGLSSNRVFESAIMTDNGYLANINELLVATLDETSLIYNGTPTFFAQLVESQTLTVDHVILMPQDVTTPDFSIFDDETGFRIKLYYTLPE